MELRDIFSLLDSVRARRTSGFAGLGLIYYRSIRDLPILALGDTLFATPTMPIKSASAITNALVEVSDRSSNWHDGFHLIDARTGALTHLSQFISPPVDVPPSDLRSFKPSGAREMAAMLASKIEAVEFSAVLGTDGEARVFRSGALIPRAALNHE